MNVMDALDALEGSSATDRTEISVGTSVVTSAEARSNAPENTRPRSGRILHSGRVGSVNAPVFPIGNRTAAVAGAFDPGHRRNRLGESYDGQITTDG